MEITAQYLQSAFASKEVVAWSMPEFLATYTLHDSQLMEWHGIRVPSISMFLVIHLDLVWNSAVPPPFDRLLIRLPIVYRANWTEGSWQDSTIEGAESARLPDEERTRLLEDGRNDVRAYQTDDGWPLTLKHPAMDETLTKTTISGINWCKLELLHAGNVEFVCASDKGELFRIPKSNRR